MDATTAMLETLAAQLRAPLHPSLSQHYKPVGSLAKVLLGWPSLESNIEYPTVAIHAPVSGDREAHAPMILALEDVEDDETKVDVVVSLGTITQPIVLDGFFDSKASRRAVLDSLDAALAGNVLDGESHLCLPSGYHGQRIGYQKRGVAFPDTSRSVGKDEWRATVDVEADIDEIVVARVARLRTLRVGIAIDPTLIENGEIFTVFEP